MGFDPALPPMLFGLTLLIIVVGEKRALRHMPLRSRGTSPPRPTCNA